MAADNVFFDGSGNSSNVSDAGFQDRYGISPGTSGPLAYLTNDQVRSWIGSDDGPQVPREILDEVANGNTSTFSTATNKPIPIVYGRARVPGLLFAMAAPTGDYFYIGVIWCLGEIQQIEKIIINGEETDPETKYKLYHRQDYLGLPSQTVNITLQARIAGYNDTLVYSNNGISTGISYSVLGFGAGANLGFPQVEAIVKGRKVYDPRNGQTAYSTNAGLCLADFISSPVYGEGLSPYYGSSNSDYGSVYALANFNDTVLGTIPGIFPPLFPDIPILRGELNYAISSVASVTSHSGALRAYANCMVVRGESTVLFIPNRDEPIAASFTAADIVEDSLTLTKRGVRDIPNVVRVSYTDMPATGAWKTKVAEVRSPGVVAGTEPIRMSEVQMPGLSYYAQAHRVATERLNHGNLVDLQVKAVFGARGFLLRKGTVISLSHPIGLTNKPLKVIECSQTSPARFSVMAEEFDPAEYSDEVVTTPTTPDTGLPTPYNIPAVTNIVATEDHFQTQTGIWNSRIRFTFDDMLSTYPYVQSYGYEVYNGTTKVADGVTTTTEGITAALSEGLVYFVKVRILAFVGLGPWGTSNPIELVGSTSVPQDPTNLDGYELGGKVYLRWTLPNDPTIWRTEIRYGAVGAAYDDMTFYSLSDSTTEVVSGLPAGQFAFAVKTIDSVQTKSANDSRKTITVSYDSTSYVNQERQIHADELNSQNIHHYKIWPGDNDRYCTDYGETFAVRFPLAMSNYNTLPLYASHGPAAISGICTLVGEPGDFGRIITGDWKLKETPGTFSSGVVYTGVFSWSMKLAATAPPPWTYFSNTLTVQGGYRYASFDFSCSGAGNGFVLISENAKVYVEASPKTETGIVTTSNGGVTTLTLVNNYMAINAVTLTAQAQGVTPLVAVWDNVVLGPPTTIDIGCINTSTNLLVAATVSYFINGI